MVEHTGGDTLVMAGDPFTLTTIEKWQLVGLGSATLIAGFYSPADNRTLAVVAVCSGIAVAFETIMTDTIHDESITRFQRILLYAFVGAASGILIDQTLRPKLAPRKPPKLDKL
jgi:hypothetical protein